MKALKIKRPAAILQLALMKHFSGHMVLPHQHHLLNQPRPGTQATAGIHVIADGDQLLVMISLENEY